MASQQPIGTPVGLPRSAILRGNEPVRILFQQGKGFRQGSIVIKYHVVELAQGEPPQQQTVLAGFFVRKGKGGAIRRNRIRRLLRESYRLVRHGFVQSLPPGLTVHLAFLWSAPSGDQQSPPPPFADIQNDVRKGLERLRRKVMKDVQEGHGPATAEP
ncbi:MAG: hypothetical protein DYG96_02115 [Chlorobi bacterium CHB2]|nr:hypothetical protein [Chlorobi bacterium CHB2]